MGLRADSHAANAAHPLFAHVKVSGDAMAVA
jgi:hypothetical protein